MTEAAKEAASHHEESALLTLVSMTLTLRGGKKEPVGEVKKKLKARLRSPKRNPA
jgi:hypothetical protein